MQNNNSNNNKPKKPNNKDFFQELQKLGAAKLSIIAGVLVIVLASMMMLLSSLSSPKTNESSNNPEITEKVEFKISTISEDKFQSLLDNAKKNNKNAEMTKYYVGHLFFPTKPFISEPMVKHPSNNDFFLHRDPFENPREKGAVFLDYEAKPNFGDPLTIIFGHSDFRGNKPNDNILFTSFRHYKDKKYMEKNREFYIVTKDQRILRGTIFAYHFVNSELPEVDDFYIINYSGPRTTSEFVKMLKSKVVNFDDSIKIQKDDKIVMFSTCNDYNKPERHVVYAKIEEVKKDAK